MNDTIRLDHDNVKEKLNKIGVSIIDKENGNYRNLDNVLMDIAKAFKKLMDKNKKETNKNIIKEREDTIDDICSTLAGGDGIRDKTKNKYALKSCLLNL